ncbi:MAG: type I DNA topoisomerase [Candidatus Fermentibacteraceae bacterium]
MADKKLVIIESPAKARSLRSYLGGEYKVIASNGHVRDLPRKRLAVSDDGEYRPTYTILPEQRQKVRKLKSAARGYRKIYLAADPDREGEAICWHLSELLGGRGKSFKRLRFNAITRESVTAAVRSPQPLDMNLVNAQQARRVMDRLVGYKVSPYLWRTVGKGLSAGRVQTVALRLVREREDRIEAFEPREYWLLHADFVQDGKSFRAALHRRKGRRTDTVASSPSSLEEARRLEEEAEAREHWNIGSVQTKIRSRRPGPPFITSTLQQAAAGALRFSPSKTMRLAQSLYEGVELQKGEHTGLITYMRTDSVRISPPAMEECRDLVRKRFGEEALSKKPRRYRSSKGAQDAHEAIRPTDPARTPGDLRGVLGGDRLKLYDLIWKRFVATQMAEAKLARTTVTVDSGDLEFTCRGERMVTPGFAEVDPGQVRLDRPLPELAEGPVTLKGLEKEQRFTKPPARFTEARLVAEMKKLGIGRPSTYVSIISTLKRRKYVSREKGKLVPTELGSITVRLLVELFPHIFETDFTARMEELLDEIARGRKDYVEVLDRLSLPLRSSLKTAMDNLGKVKRSLSQETDEECPRCGAPLAIRWGKYGRFYACTAFPECRYTRPLEEDMEEAEVDRRCPECGGRMLVRRGRYGRFLGCENAPDCRHTEPLPTGVSCPREGCDGELVERKSRKGKRFYSCNRYPECDYAIWNPPLDERCPRCGFPILEKRSRGIYCPNCRKKIRDS